MMTLHVSTSPPDALMTPPVLPAGRFPPIDSLLPRVGMLANNQSSSADVKFNRDEETTGSQVDEPIQYTLYW